MILPCEIYGATLLAFSAASATCTSAYLGRHPELASAELTPVVAVLIKRRIALFALVPIVSMAVAFCQHACAAVLRLRAARLDRISSRDRVDSRSHRGAGRHRADKHMHACADARSATPPVKGRGATFNPGEPLSRRHARAVRRRLAAGAGIGRRRAAAAQDDRHDPARAHDHRAQRFAGHPVHAVDQSVPGLRARLHLLLRAAVARVSRPVAGHRLRDEALREAGRGARCCAPSSRSPAIAATRSRSAPTPIPTSRSSANGR